MAGRPFTGWIVTELVGPLRLEPPEDDIGNKAIESRRPGAWFKAGLFDEGQIMAELVGPSAWNRRAVLDNDVVETAIEGLPIVQRHCSHFIMVQHVYIWVAANVQMHTFNLLHCM